MSSTIKIIRMPVFAILILSAVFHLVACSSENGLASREGLNSGAANAQTPKNEIGKTTNSASGFVGEAIELPHYPPDFPPGAGRELFMTRCGMCHSLRYVTMQPNFTKKAWSKEVDKMIKTYGAHINKKEAQEITEYLFSVKGKPEAAK